jgi:hypothetical protein
MRRAPLVAAAAVLVALGVTVAPALSSKHYRPEPVDFSMAGGELLGDPRPSAGVVSEPLRAPKRFNLLGLKWAAAAGHDEPALAVRTRADGGQWTPWTPVFAHSEDGPDPGSGEARAVGMSNPVWAGEADWVQYRSSERLRGLRLHFVNTAGTATAGDRLRTALRSGVSTALTTAAGVLHAGIAGAAEPQPAIVARSDWADDDCPPRTAPSYGEVKAAYVHHTVNANDYTRAEAAQIVLAICRFHRNGNGWNDIGYNFLVDRFGTIYEGRAGGIAAAVIGAQAEGFNSQTTGIANIGTFSDVGQSQAALEAMARLIRWKLPLHGYSTSGTAVLESAGGASNRYAAGQSVRVQRVIGHRDTNATECPGSGLHAQLAELRGLVGGISPQGTATSVTAEADAARSAIDYGDTATVSGTLATRDGAPLGGQPVLVQARVDGRWKTSSTPTTAADGSFSATVRPKVSRVLRARFAGAGELRSSVASSFALAVRPVVAFTRPPRRGAAGLTVRLRGKVTPRRGRVYQVLQLQRRGRFRKVGVKALRTTRKGGFRGSFVPSAPGTYRFYVATRADSKLARGSSRKVVVRVGEAARAVRGGARSR